MNRKNSRIILILFALALLSFVTGCATTQKLMPVSSEMTADRIMMMPPEMKCCNEYNASYDLNQEPDDTCCSLTEFPAACNECIVNETQRQAEIMKNRTNYRGTSSFERFLLFIPIILIILTLISLLLLIADKITSVAKDSADGFLKHKWKKVLMIFVLSVVAVFLIFYVIIRVFN